MAHVGPQRHKEKNENLYTVPHVIMINHGKWDGRVCNMHDTDDNFIQHSWGIAEETNSGPRVDEDNIKMSLKG